jgi:hypothetical protein
MLPAPYLWLAHALPSPHTQLIGAFAPILLAKLEVPPPRVAHLSEPN